MNDNQSFASPAYIIKVGGSVITNKEGRYSLNEDVIEKLANVFPGLPSNISNRIVLVLGGGSFGNLAPIDYRLDPVGDWSLVDTPMMTVRMFQMLSGVVDVFRSASVPVYPFQASSLISYDEGQTETKLNFNIRPIREVMKRGLIPVISGDLIFFQDSFRILSSDDIPVIIASQEGVKIEKVLYYSDVDGLMNTTTNLVIKEVNFSNFNKVSLFAGPSGKRDVTGGMKTKLNAMASLGSFGVESEILNIRYFDRILASCQGTQHFGTKFLVENKCL